MVHNVLNRCLVVEFYRQNAALFGLLFLVFFGFIKFSEHLAIGGFFVSNPSAMLILFILWSIYLIKILLFILPAIQLKQNQFLAVFGLFPLYFQITSALLSSCLLFLPILCYTAFLLFLAIGGDYWVAILFLTVQAIAITTVLCAILMFKLRQNRKEASYFHIRFLNRFAKPGYLFFIEHLLRNEIVLLLLSKLYTSSMLIGTAALYRTDTFDIRLMTTGILLAQVGNVAIFHKYVWFHFHKMTFTKNLPYSLIRILLHHWSVLLLLILPELLLILRHYPLPPTAMDIVGLLTFTFSVATFTYALLIIKQKELSNAMLSLFWFIVCTTMIILFSVHPLLLAAIGVLISSGVMYLRYDKFEYIE